MSEPLVSILTPFKNTGKYISECIQSVIDQSHTHWELLVVNDHSDDNSLEIAQHYALLDSRITVINNQDVGIIEALKLAFSLSKGEFITRMDSDDIMHTDKLSTMVKQLKRAGKGHIALGLVQYFGDIPISPLYREYENWLNTLTREGQNFEERYKECSIPSPCWMTRQSDLAIAGGFDSPFYPEDYDLMFRFYQTGLKTLKSNAILHYWRDYETRTSKQSANYKVDRFTQLKTHYFLECDYDASRPLAILGAGTKSKLIIQKLHGRYIDIHWITANPNKTRTEVHGIQLQTWEDYQKLDAPQTIVTFKDAKQQTKIVDFFRRKGLLPNTDYFMFC